VRVEKTTLRGALRADELSLSGSLILDDSVVRDAILARNAKIEGRVSARRIRCDGELSLDGSRIGGRLELTDAQLRARPVSLRVENVHVADAGFVNSSVPYGAFHANGQVLLAGSEFAGGLNCTGLTIANSDSTLDVALPALDGRNVKVGGELFLNHGTVAGTVLLTAAEIRGQLNMSGLKLINQPGAAIDARGMRVGTDAWLDDCFEASSAVIFDRSSFGGSLNAVAGRFTANQDLHSEAPGVALSLISATIGGSLVLADEPWTVKHKPWRGSSGFVALGTVLLTDAHIGRRLEASGGIFDGCEKDALRADGIKVEADARLTGHAGPNNASRFHAQGPVKLTRATIEGSLDFSRARLTELDASLARIRDRLVLRELELRGSLSLAGAQVSTLSDDDSYWHGGDNTLELDGFTYRILERESLSSRTGSEWLARSPRYRAQPYIQLARVESDMGRTADARRLHIERHRARLARQPPPANGHIGARLLSRCARAVDRVAGLLVGWGYARWRLAVVWVLMLGGAFVIFHWAGRHDLLRPTDPPLTLRQTSRAAQVTPISSRCDPSYPCFEALAYSIDVVLPIIDLKQRDRWYVDSRTADGEYVATADLVFTLAGWLLATLFVASFTNVLKEE
jgi:hypothetical protein